MDPTLFFSQQQGLEDFFKVQNVSEENQMFCDDCNKKQDTDIVRF